MSVDNEGLLAAMDARKQSLSGVDQTWIGGLWVVVLALSGSQGKRRKRTEEQGLCTALFVCYTVVQFIGYSSVPTLPLTYSDPA